MGSHKIFTFSATCEHPARVIYTTIPDTWPLDAHLLRRSGRLVEVEEAESPFREIRQLGVKFGPATAHRNRMKQVQVKTLT